MKTKLPIRPLLVLALAVCLGGGWLLKRSQHRAENQTNAVAAASASALDRSSAGVPGQFKFCQRPEEAPAWSVAYGKEFWHPGETHVAGNIALHEVVERVRHAFTADPATQRPALRAKNYAAHFNGNGLKFSPHVPPGSNRGVTPAAAATATTAAAFQNDPDAMENVKVEQQVFAADEAARIAPQMAGQPQPLAAPRRAALQMPQPDPWTEITFRTVAVWQDDQALYRADETSLAGTVVGNTLQSLLDPALGLIEHFQAEADGVHVTWVLAQKPPGNKLLTVEAELTGLALAGRSGTGWHFADASGVARVGVSDVTAVDSSGRSWPLELQANGAGLRVTIPENVLAQAAFPLAIDPTIFPEFGLDNPVSARAPSDQQKPAIAANGGTFLVVWEDSRSFAATQVDIFGARVSAAGAVLDPAGISITTVGGAAPAVAALGSGFLVVWEDSRNANTSGVDIYGTRVTSAGAVTDPTGIPISGAAGDQLAPAMASAGTSALVVWQDARNVSSDIDIYGTIVQSNGIVSNPSGLPMATSAGPQFSPDVAFNGNRYFVVWSDASGDVVALSGTRVTTAGVVSAAISIDASGPAHLQPSVAAAGTTFLVVWEDYRNAGITFIDILGKRVSDAGAVLDGAPFPIGTAFSDRFTPAATGGTNFLVVWQDGRNLGTSGNDLYAARVGTNGAILDPSGIPISTALNDQTSPALAFNGTNYFIAWTDARNTSTSGLDIYGTILGAGGSGANTNGTLLSSGASGEQHPTVAANGANYLVVWEDSRNADTTGIDLYGVRVSTNGVPLDLSGIPISIAAGDQTAPAATALGSSPSGANYFIAWQDSRNTATTGADIYGARLSTMGAVLDSSGIPISRAAGDQLTPAVASSGAAFLVVWQDARNVASQGLDIYGARVSSAGVVTETSGLPISTAVGNQFSPAVNFAGGTYLVVWTDARNQGTTDNDIYGARVSTAGAVTEPGGLPISRAAGDELAPALAPNGADFLVVWQDARNLGSTDYDIFGARVTSGGVVSDASGFAIGVAANAQSLPAVAANGTNLLVVWQDARGGGADVYGTRVDGATVRDPLGVVINTGVAGQQFPALASGSSRAFLVVNQAVRGGAERIVGNLVWLDDNPFITRITRAIGSATLTWTSITGRTYRVQYRTNITDLSWFDLSGDLLANGNSATKTDNTIGTALTRFYRLCLLP